MGLKETVEQLKLRREQNLSIEEIDRQRAERRRRDQEAKEQREGERILSWLKSFKESDIGRQVLDLIPKGKALVLSENCNGKPGMYRRDLFLLKDGSLEEHWTGSDSEGPLPCVLKVGHPSDFKEMAHTDLILSWIGRGEFEDKIDIALGKEKFSNVYGL